MTTGFIAQLAGAIQRPACFEPDTVLFWDDPYIAEQMLKAHLDPGTDAASRRPETIDASADWIFKRLNLPAGASLLDLGCGPGLYSARFAARGYDVTGIDISENSLRYARAHDPASTYIHASYLTLDAINRYDAAVLIYGDICVLNDAERYTVLNNVYRALQPGGCFIFDVTTPAHPNFGRDGTRWSVSAGGGFWKPGPYAELLQMLHYPEASTGLERYFVLEESGTLHEYRVWTRYYTLATITAALQTAGFTVLDYFADLTGTPWQPDAPWMGVVAGRSA